MYSPGKNRNWYHDIFWFYIKAGATKDEVRMESTEYFKEMLSDGAKQAYTHLKVAGDKVSKAVSADMDLKTGNYWSFKEDSMRKGIVVHEYPSLDLFFFPSQVFDIFRDLCDDDQKRFCTEDNVSKWPTDWKIRGLGCFLDL